MTEAEILRICNRILRDSSRDARAMMREPVNQARRYRRDEARFLPEWVRVNRMMGVRA